MLYRSVTKLRHSVAWFIVSAYARKCERVVIAARILPFEYWHKKQLEAKKQFYWSWDLAINVQMILGNRLYGNTTWEFNEKYDSFLL
jgi:hypothetical protein